jgi:hypothetical protein
MAAISAASIILLADKLVAYWLAALGTDAAAAGMRTVGAAAGAYKKADDLVELVKDLDDIDQLATLADGVRTFRNNTDAYNSVGGIAGPLINNLDVECQRSAGVASLASVNTLDTFLTYYNVGTGGPWNALMSPDYRNLYYAAKKSYPTAWNVYQEILQGGTYANGMRRLVVGTGQTAGQGIDSTQYAGGFGQIKWSGASGSGAVTVTGTWRKIDGSVDTGDGTANLSGASGTAVLTPPFANALLLTVTAISAVVGVSAGTIYAETAKPSGRTNPPT